MPIKCPVVGICQSIKKINFPQEIVLIFFFENNFKRLKTDRWITFQIICKNCSTEILESCMYFARNVDRCFSSAQTTDSVLFFLLHKSISAGRKSCIVWFLWIPELHVHFGRLNTAHGTPRQVQTEIINIHASNHWLLFHFLRNN